MDIDITGDMIRLGQLLKLANLVADGAEAKDLIADGAVWVDGQRETRRGRQLGIGSVVEIDLPSERRSVRVVSRPSR